MEVFVVLRTCMKVMMHCIRVKEIFIEEDEEEGVSEVEEVVAVEEVVVIIKMLAGKDSVIHILTVTLANLFKVLVSFVIIMDTVHLNVQKNREQEFQNKDYLLQMALLIVQIMMQITLKEVLHLIRTFFMKMILHLVLNLLLKVLVVVQGSGISIQRQLDT